MTPSYQILVFILLVLWHLVDCREVPLQRRFENDDYAESRNSDKQGQSTATYILIPASDANGYNAILNDPKSRSDNYMATNKNKGTHHQQYRHPEMQQPKLKDTKNAPVQTIKNYNKVNEDGSFTFGYEAADGSFKEENRGTDCVVRGKYGYIDPDGNKREFTYVSGNPCDPNTLKETNQNDDYDSDNDNGNDSENEEEEEEEREQDNYPKKPMRPIGRKPVTFQNSHIEDDRKPYQPERQFLEIKKGFDENGTFHRLDIKTFVKVNVIESDKHMKQNAYVATSPTSILFQNDYNTPVEITPRPSKVLPATTYRPQLIQFSVTPNIASVKPTEYSFTTPKSNILNSGYKQESNQFNFLNEFQKFNEHVKSMPSQKTEKVNPSQDPIYASQLIFDPQSGQYNMALYQSIPSNNGNFLINHQIQPYVHQADKYETTPSSNPTVQYYQPKSLSTSQAVYQQQQAGTQFRNSQKLFDQQQKMRSIQKQLEPYQQYVVIAAPQNSHNQYSGHHLEDFIRGNKIQL